MAIGPTQSLLWSEEFVTIMAVSYLKIHGILTLVMDHLLALLDGVTMNWSTTPRTLSTSKIT